MNFIDKKIELKNSKIDFIGENNIVISEEKCTLLNSRILFRGDNNILIIKSIYIKLIATFGSDSVLFIDKNVSMTNSITVHLAEGEDVLIGKNCMFASLIKIFNTDLHPIFSRETGERVNLARTTIIGDDVWLCDNVTVIKGAYIPNGSVIGTFSVVTGFLPVENSIYAGNPAKLIKSNIVWTRTLLQNNKKIIKKFDKFCNNKEKNNNVDKIKKIKAISDFNIKINEVNNFIGL